jgi:hypothetical protein
MLIRAIALSIALLVGVGVIVPLATESTEAVGWKLRKSKKQKRYKKYSKRWWRQYRAKMRRKRALAARRRALRLRQLRLARVRRAQKAGSIRKPVVARAAVPASEPSASLLPTGQAAPEGWRKGNSTAGEIQFRVDDSSGIQVGTAAISVVGPAMGESRDIGRNKMLAGVPTTSLRREVINRMIAENGWVVNDYQKDIGGKKVYVVVAQSQSGSRVNSRMFYFTEVDGRIYSVATNTSVDSAERIAAESEKVIFSLQSGSRSTQRASLRE